MKIGVNLSIDVKSIIKERMITHSNGKTYLNMTAFIDTEVQGQYGDNGMITHAKTKEEAKDAQMKILGNVKVFYKKESEPQQQAQNYGQNSQQQAPENSQATAPNEGGFQDDEDIPF